MISDNEVHQESKIASGFTKWFEANRNYVELYDDTDTTGGDPFDSAGIIGEKIYFFVNFINTSSDWCEMPGFIFALFFLRLFLSVMYFVSGTLLFFISMEF